MTIVKFFEIVAGVVFITGLVITTIWLIGESRKKAYNKDYAFLFSCVSYYVVNHHNFDKISKLFRQLRMNDQFPEQTNALWIIFQEKYYIYFQNDDMAIVEPKQ